MPPVTKALRFVVIFNNVFSGCLPCRHFYHLEWLHLSAMIVILKVHRRFIPLTKAVCVKQPTLLILPYTQGRYEK